MNPSLKKVTPSFPATPCQCWGPVKLPLFGNLVQGSTPLPLQEGRCTLWCNNDFLLVYNSFLCCWYIKGYYYNYKQTGSSNLQTNLLNVKGTISSLNNFSNVIHYIQKFGDQCKIRTDKKNKNWEKKNEGKKENKKKKRRRRDI